MKIVCEHDEEYDSYYEFLCVGRTVIWLDGGVDTVQREMWQEGLMGEHSPSGLSFEKVGFDDYEWEWHPWEHELDVECAYQDSIDEAIARAKCCAA